MPSITIHQRSALSPSPQTVSPSGTVLVSVAAAVTGGRSSVAQPANSGRDCRSVADSSVSDMVMFAPLLTVLTGRVLGWLTPRSRARRGHAPGRHGPGP